MDQVSYAIVRSQRRTMVLQVKNDLSVVVRAPSRVPKETIERFVKANEAWIERQLRQARLRREAFPEPTDQELMQLRRQAEQVIPGRVALYARRMGLNPSCVRIGAARTRFGSCSGKNSLNFSCLLMRYPLEAVDYVVVHELAHIAHKNHGPAFHALVESTLPDWCHRRALLRQY